MAERQGHPAREHLRPSGRVGHQQAVDFALLPSGSPADPGCFADVATE